MQGLLRPGLGRRRRRGGGIGTFATLPGGDEAARAALAGAVVDPAGTFWRYGWAAGMPARLPPLPRSEGETEDRPAGPVPRRRDG